MAAFAELVFICFISNLFIVVLSSKETKVEFSCADPDCRDPVSEGITINNYPSGKENFLSFPSNIHLTILGKSESVLIVEINGKRGFAPRNLISELSKHVKTFTHVYKDISAPVDQTESDADHDADLAAEVSSSISYTESAVEASTKNLGRTSTLDLSDNSLHLPSATDAKGIEPSTASSSSIGISSTAGAVPSTERDDRCEVFEGTRICGNQIVPDKDSESRAGPTIDPSSPVTPSSLPTNPTPAPYSRGHFSPASENEEAPSDGESGAVTPSPNEAQTWWPRSVGGLVGNMYNKAKSFVSLGADAQNVPEIKEQTESENKVGEGGSESTADHLGIEVSDSVQSSGQGQTNFYQSRSLMDWESKVTIQDYTTKEEKKSEDEKDSINGGTRREIKKEIKTRKEEHLEEQSMSDKEIDVEHMNETEDINNKSEGEHVETKGPEKLNEKQSVDVETTRSEPGVVETLVSERFKKTEQKNGETTESDRLNTIEQKGVEIDSVTTEQKHVETEVSVQSNDTEQLNVTKVSEQLGTTERNIPEQKNAIDHIERIKVLDQLKETGDRKDPRQLNLIKHKSSETLQPDNLNKTEQKSDVTKVPDQSNTTKRERVEIRDRSDEAEREKALKGEREEGRLRKEEEQKRQMEQVREDERLRIEKEREDAERKAEENERLRIQRERDEAERLQKVEEESRRIQREESERQKKKAEDDEHLRIEKEREENERLQKQKAEEENRLRIEEEEEEETKEQRSGYAEIDANSGDHSDREPHLERKEDDAAKETVGGESEVERSFAGNDFDIDDSAEEVNATPFKDDYVDATSLPAPDESLDWIQFIRITVQAVVDILPSPVYEKLAAMKSSGLSLHAAVVTFMTGLFSVLFLSFNLFLQRRSKEAYLNEKLCSSEQQLFKVSTERDVLREELATAKQQSLTLHKSLQEQQNKSRPLQKYLDNVKMERDSLKETVASLERQLEGATEAGLELNAMLSDFLTSQNQNGELHTLAETLQGQLALQQDDIQKMQDERIQWTAQSQHLEGRAETAEMQVATLTHDLRQKSLEWSETQLVLQEKESELSELQSEVQQLKQTREELLVEAQEWNVRVIELHQQVESYGKRQAEADEALAEKQREVEMLNEVIDGLGRLASSSQDQTQVKDKLAELLDVSKVKLDLKCTEELLRQRNEQFDAKDLECVQAEARAVEAEEKLRMTMESYQKAVQAQTEAQTKLEVLSAYFSEKETHLQKELGTQVAIRQQKEDFVSLTEHKVADIVHENLAAKEQMSSMRLELQETERSLKAQVLAQEKKAHENWLAARSAERKLEEAKQESNALRQKLTLLERNNSQLAKQPKKADYINGELASSDPDDPDSSSSSLRGPAEIRMPPMFPPFPLPADRPLPPPQFHVFPPRFMPPMHRASPSFSPESWRYRPGHPLDGRMSPMDSDRRSLPLGRPSPPPPIRRMSPPPYVRGGRASPSRGDFDRRSDRSSPGRDYPPRRDFRSESPPSHLPRFHGGPFAPPPYLALQRRDLPPGLHQTQQPTDRKKEGSSSSSTRPTRPPSLPKNNGPTAPV